MSERFSQVRDSSDFQNELWVGPQVREGIRAAQLLKCSKRERLQSETELARVKNWCLSEMNKLNDLSNNLRLADSTTIQSLWTTPSTQVHARQAMPIIVLCMAQEEAQRIAVIVGKVAKDLGIDATTLSGINPVAADRQVDWCTSTLPAFQIPSDFDALPWGRNHGGISNDDSNDSEEDALANEEIEDLDTFDASEQMCPLDVGSLQLDSARDGTNT